MGHELHATRADHWTRTAGSEITAAEWKEVVTWDPSLRCDPKNGPHAVHWVSEADTPQGWFDWYDGVVYTTDPDRASAGKLFELAERMNAKVQGDGGEVYERTEDWEAALEQGTSAP